jgi:hypothetical protein
MANVKFHGFAFSDCNGTPCLTAIVVGFGVKKWFGIEADRESQRSGGFDIISNEFRDYIRKYVAPLLRYTAETANE